MAAQLRDLLKNSQIANLAELHSKSEPITCPSFLCNQHSIYIIQMEVACKLIGREFTRIASMILMLLYGTVW